MTKDFLGRVCAVPGCERKVGSRGSHVRYCTEHQDPARRVEALRHAAVGGDPEAERLLKRAKRNAPLPPTGAQQFVQLQRFAIYLGGLGDPKRAAELAGIQVDAAGLVDLEAQARRECGDLVEGKQSAATTLGNMAMLLLLQRTCELAPQLMGPQVSATLRTVAETLDGLQGGFAPVYSDVRAVISLEPPKLDEGVE
jgi:hypothetical protein